MTEPAALVLLVEDEPQMRRFLRASLGVQGFRLLEAETAGEALRLVTQHAPELVLLDLGLPDGDGVELVEKLRGWSRVPVIVVSARGREADKVRALDAGADDYLTKPFGMNELLARMRVALRHAQQAAGPTSLPLMEIGPLRIDQTRREVSRSGQLLHLTPTEYRLLVLLALNAGRVLTYRHILKEIWGTPALGQTHYVRVYMATLRKKLEPDSARPRLLITEPGVGYRLRDTVPAE